MTSINFHQTVSDDLHQGNFKQDGLDKGFFISIGVLVITLLVWGGFKVFTMKVQRDNVAMQEQIDATKQSFAKEKVNAAVDFQQRLAAIEKNETQKITINKTMDAVKAVMVPNVHLTSFSQSGAGVEMDMASTDFLSVARQLLSLKNSKSFSNVKISKIQHVEKEITFHISTSLN